jgi:RepB plasmid partitioning protein
MKQVPAVVNFRREVVELPLRYLVALKAPKPSVIDSCRYRRIRASLEHNSLVAPLTVLPQAKNRYLVVDGNLRLNVLKDLMITKARCTTILEEESYAYSRRVTVLSPIAEYVMILEALRNGVTEKRLAAELRVGVRAIRLRKRLLNGIAPKAVELLKRHGVSSITLGYLQKMESLQQIQAAQLMISGNDCSSLFAAALSNLTSPCQHGTRKRKRETGESSRSRVSVLFEDDMDGLVSELSKARRTYGTDALAVTVVCRWLEHLSQNAAVAEYLRRNHTKVHQQIRQVMSHVNTERIALQ